MKRHTISTTDEQESLVKFTKSFKTPAPIPEQGIQQAIKLMQKGRLYRYHLSDDLSNYSNS